MKNRLKIIKKYRHKVLGVGQVKNYFIDDFFNIDELIGFLYDVFDTESYLTPDGYNFLSEYYGLDKVASILIEHGGELADKSPDHLKKWLGNIVFDPSKKTEGSYKEERINLKDGSYFTIIHFKKNHQ